MFEVKGGRQREGEDCEGSPKVNSRATRIHLSRGGGEEREERWSTHRTSGESGLALATHQSHRLEHHWKGSTPPAGCESGLSLPHPSNPAPPPFCRLRTRFLVLPRLAGQLQLNPPPITPQASLRELNQSATGFHPACSSSPAVLGISPSDRLH